MEARADLSRALFGWDDPDGIMRRITRGALNLVPAAEAAAVELLDADGCLVPVCIEGQHPGAVTRLRPDRSLSGLSMVSRTAQRCDDVELDHHVDLAAARAVDARSVLCVPLILASVPVGVFVVTSSKTHAFDDTVLETLGELAGFLSAVVSAVVTIDRSAASHRLATVGASRPSNRSHRNGQGSPTLLEPVAATEADRVATFVTDVLRPDTAGVAATRARIERVIETRAVSTVFQPVVKLARRTVVAIEALARFPGTPDRTPDLWFSDAHAVGLGIELELLAVEQALAVLHRLPPNVTLSVNASPMAVASPGLARLLSAVDASRVGVEITEHVAVDDYVILGRRISVLRALGTRISIDDTGSGYASFRHILSLSPEYIKLDLALTRNIDTDRARRALAAALVVFVNESGARLIAEGIETAGELGTVQELGIEFGQGYHLGRPVPVETLDIPGLRH